MFIIRPVTEADLAGVRACLTATWHATYDAIFGAEQVSAISARWHAIETLRANLATPQSIFLVAVRDESIIGTTSARLIETSVIQVGRLYVLPEWQGQGCGKTLIDAAITAFPDATRVTLDVEPRNAGAIGFYRAQGFDQVRLIERDHAGSVDIAAVFEKSITRRPDQRGK